MPLFWDICGLMIIPFMMYMSLFYGLSGNEIGMVDSFTSGFLGWVW